MTPGIPVGGLCASCGALVRRKAARIARWAAIGTTLPLAVYVHLALPPDATARLLGLVAVLIWYVLTSLIARRVALEWLK
jgi:cytochrome bd-type quinol oxidase subunit 2